MIKKLIRDIITEKLICGFNFKSVYTNGEFLYIRLERCASKFIANKFCCFTEERTLNGEVVVFKYDGANDLFYISDVLTRKDFKVPRLFVVVRHPYERFLSTLDLQIRSSNNGEPTIHGPLKSVQELNPLLYNFFDIHNPIFLSKDKFVDQVIDFFYNNDGSFFESNSYNVWKPQTNKLLSNCPGYDDLKILKLENFENEFEETFGVPYKNNDKTERKFFENYILTTEQKEKLKKIYEIDFKNLDYD